MVSKELQEGLLKRVLNHRGLTNQQPPRRTHKDNMLIQCLKGKRQQEIKDARIWVSKLEEEKEMLRRENHLLTHQNSDLEQEVSSELFLGQSQGSLCWDEHCF